MPKKKKNNHSKRYINAKDNNINYQYVSVSGTKPFLQLSYSHFLVSIFLANCCITRLLFTCLDQKACHDGITFWSHKGLFMSLDIIKKHTSFYHLCSNHEFIYHIMSLYFLLIKVILTEISRVCTRRRMPLILGNARTRRSSKGNFYKQFAKFYVVTFAVH